MADKPEVWLRGPLADMPTLLQPVAHALMQAREEVSALLTDFPDALLWAQPVGVASVGFHGRHLSGVLDRLLTYARQESLTDKQLTYLSSESEPDKTTTSADLIRGFNEQVDQALAQLRTTDPATLTEFRGVGRTGLPSTVLGLLTHAAEHTMRHVGQLSVTVRVLKS